MATTYYELADLVSATLFADMKGKITNLDPTLLRSYPWANRMVKKNIVQMTGGLDARWRVNVTGNSSASHFSAYQTYNRSVNDHLKTAQMQLRGTHVDYSFDVLEPEFNSGEYEVVDVIKNRQQQAKISMTKQIEADGWGYALVDDDVTPQGILYWLPYTSTTATDTNKGFTGTVPSGHTTIAGLNPSTYTGWKSQGDVYAAVTDGDLILKMRNSSARILYQAPLKSMLISDFSTGLQYGIYMNLQTLTEVEDLGKAQNDDIGYDLASFAGRMLFKGTPIEEVPTLEDNSRDPVICINWGVMQNHVKRGWWMKEAKAPGRSDQPTAVTYDMWCMNQPIMLDRRTGGYNISKAA